MQTGIISYIIWVTKRVTERMGMRKRESELDMQGNVGLM